MLIPSSLSSALLLQFTWFFLLNYELALPTADCLASSTVPRKRRPLRPFSSFVRYRARVAYEGSGFSGFQYQDALRRTVQSVLEEALRRRFAGAIRDGDDHDNIDDCRPIRVVAAGRTDAGVHARGQAIHFDVPRRRQPSARQRRRNNGNDNIEDNADNDQDEDEYDLESVQTSLNKMLTPDVRIYNLQKAPKPRYKQITIAHVNGTATTTRLFQWNVLYDSTQKLYSYRLCLAPVMDPLERHHRWHPDNAHTINVTQLHEVLQAYVGTHDFRAFCGGVEQLEKKKKQEQEEQLFNMGMNNMNGGDDATTTTDADEIISMPTNTSAAPAAASTTIDTVRTVYKVQLVDEHEEQQQQQGNAMVKMNYYRIDFYLQGALYKQVRNMVRTALDVCSGAMCMSQDHFLFLLHSNSSNATRRDNKSKPAPPQGLTLEYVYFENDNNNDEAEF